MTSPQTVPLIFGSVGYSSSHPSRWAGTLVSGARLKVVEDCVVLTPLWPWRQLFRMPVVRIPLSNVKSVFRITFGIKFSVLDDPTLDGTRFKRKFGGARRLEDLIQLMQSRGITVHTMSRSKRISGFVGDIAVSHRPGLIWRDRGRFGFLESAVALAIALTVLSVTGFFSDLSTLGRVLVAVMITLTLCGSFAGYRLRKKVPRSRASFPEPDRM
jgi:hypothetical protein